MWNRGYKRPSQVSVNRYIWRAKVEELVNGPQEQPLDPAVYEEPVAAGRSSVKGRSPKPPKRPPSETSGPRVNPTSRKVFVVHGHDKAARLELTRVLETLNLEPMTLEEKANQGRTIIEKFEQNSDVAFAVVLLTPDDMGAKKGAKVQPRARENVFLEAGYFLHALGRHNVALLKKPDVVWPSDLQGVVYIAMDEARGWVTQLVTELKSAGLEVDANRLFEPHGERRPSRSVKPRRRR